MCNCCANALVVVSLLLQSLVNVVILNSVMLQSLINVLLFGFLFCFLGVFCCFFSVSLLLQSLINVWCQSCYNHWSMLLLWCTCSCYDYQCSCLQTSVVLFYLQVVLGPFVLHIFNRLLLCVTSICTVNFEWLCMGKLHVGAFI